LKGRYIGECTRLIYELIHKLEEDDIPGLLLLRDFEKAFDTWIEAFYCDISSAVTSNGHVSKFFLLGRGFRQETLCPPCPPSHLGTWLCEGGGHESEAVVSGKLF
jgi:hypothetical protein